MTKWQVRLVNILSNSGMYFVVPYIGSAVITVPSLEIALFSGTIGLILSASREGLDYVREQTRKQ
jgi:hypothetical protein